MKVRLALCIAAFFAMLAPALAQDTRGLAPADEYFGHYKLSVLGIANTIRDAGARLDAGSNPNSMFGGPLDYVTDAIKDWQHQYPGDPWIAKDLLALEAVYLKVPSDEGFRRASQTEAWLVADFPNTDQAAEGRSELALNRIPYMPQQDSRNDVAQQPAYQAPQQQSSYAQPQQPVYVQQQQPVYVQQQQPVYVQSQQPVYVQSQPIVVQQQPIVIRGAALPSYAIPFQRYQPQRQFYRRY